MSRSAKSKNDEDKKPSKSRGRPKRQDMPSPPDYDENSFNNDKKGKSRRINTYSTVQHTSDGTLVCRFPWQKSWDAEYLFGTGICATEICDAIACEIGMDEIDFRDGIYNVKIHLVYYDVFITHMYTRRPIFVIFLSYFCIFCTFAFNCKSSLNVLYYVLFLCL